MVPAPKGRASCGGATWGQQRGISREQGGKERKTHLGELNYGLEASCLRAERSGQGHLRRELSVSRTIIGFNAELIERKIVLGRKKVMEEDPLPLPSQHRPETGHPGPSGRRHRGTRGPPVGGRLRCLHAVPPASRLCPRRGLGPRQPVGCQRTGCEPRAEFGAPCAPAVCCEQSPPQEPCQSGSPGEAHAEPTGTPP